MNQYFKKYSVRDLVFMSSAIYYTVVLMVWLKDVLFEKFIYLIFFLIFISIIFAGYTLRKSKQANYLKGERVSLILIITDFFFIILWNVM